MENKYNKTLNIENVDKNILIVGDSCEDVFIYGQVNRIAPEGPVPILNPFNLTKNGGMSKNVKSNLEALGCQCDLITNVEIITKTRFIDDRTNTLMLRVDENDNVQRIDQNILKNIKNNYFNHKYYDAIIISDYCKGFLTEFDIKSISTYNKNVFLDTKKTLGNWCKNVDFIKINHVEFDKTKHTLKSLNLEDKLIITHSDKGCEYKGILYPVEKVNIKDLSGAGDTFISGFVAEYCKSKNIISSIKFAQKCATIVVQKKGVCTV